MVWYVRVKTKTSKTSHLLGSRGTLTRRLVHAIRFEALETAEKVCAQVRTEPPEWLETIEPVAAVR